MVSVDAEYSYLWDGTELGWCLVRSERTETYLSVKWAEMKPSVSELAAIRHIIPDFRDKSPKQVANYLGSEGKVVLGPYSPVQAQSLLEQCRDEGLAVIQEETSCIGYLPCNRNTQMALVIEDDETSNYVVNRMIEAGIEVVEDIQDIGHQPDR